MSNSQPYPPKQLSSADHSSRRRDLFDAAVELTPAARDAFLRANTIDEPELLEEIRSLLRYYETVAVPETEHQSPSEYSLIGNTIGGCRVLRHLGSGGMGVVYEAEQLHPHRQVAIKILRPGIDNKSLLARIKHEAELLGRLCHPGIARIYGSGSFDDGHGGVPYFIMELIEHALPITDYADAHQLDTRQRIELIKMVCESIHHGHERGVIHRDLKPGNILVDEHGVPRVIDFGVATTDAEADSPITQLTRQGQMIGTLQYMSPEQVDSKQHNVDARTDVYGLGCVLYELLAGRPPIDLDGRPLHEVVRAICDTAPQPLALTDRMLRGDLETICGTAMSKEPSRRYQSAAALQNDLQRHLRFEPIMARPPSMLYLTGRFVRRHRTPVALATVLIAVLSTTLIMVSSSLARETARRHRAEHEHNRVKQVLATIGDSLDSIDHPKDGEAPLLAMLEEMTRNADAGALQEPTAEAAVRRMVSAALRRSGRIPEAAAQLTIAANLYEQHAGLDDPETQNCMLDLAALHSDLDHGLYDQVKAGDCARRVLRWRETHFGQNDPRTMDAAETLAWSQRNYKGGEESRPLYKQLISWLRSQSNIDHERLVGVLLPYGLTQHRRPTMDQAVACYREAGELARTHLGPTHWSIDESRILQALAQRDLQRFDDAALTLEEILPDLIAASDPGNTDVLRNRALYASILARGGHGDEGIAEIEEALARIRPHIEANHPSFVLARTKRLQLLLWAGRLPQCLTECEAMWTLANDSGELPRGTILSVASSAAAILCDRAATQRWVDRYAAWEPLWPDEVLPRGVKAMDTPLHEGFIAHVDFMVYETALAEHLMNAGHMDLARAMLQRVVSEGRKSSVAPWLIARAEVGLAGVEARNGHPDRAAELRAAAINRTSQNSPSWLTPLCKHNASRTAHAD